jgi:glycine oxidase
VTTGSASDVIVVGCGVIGAAVAWRLAQRGANVTCLDPAPGGGATHAAAGMLAAVTEADFGEHDRTILGVASAKSWPEFARELEAETGRDVGLRQCGSLTVAYDHGDRAQLDRLAQLQQAWGLAAEQVSVARARELEPLLGPRIAAASWAPDDHEVDPRRVQQALEAALDRRGVPIRARGGAGRRTPAPPGARADTGVDHDAGDKLHADAVVLAAGWESNGLTSDLPGVVVPTRPVKGQVIRLDATNEPAFSLTRVVRGYVQMRPIYIVPRHDGEVVIGSTSEEQPDDRLLTAGGIFSLLRDARAIVPGLDELPISDLTARARPGSPDNVPMIGDTAVPGLLLATGHYRNGILLAPLTAEAIAARLTGGDLPDAVKVADPRRFGASDRDQAEV